eukprot:symbB.v1.2.019212.t1/scaffold1563.1/size111508/5
MSQKLVAQKLAPVFGKDGDFTVVVEDTSEDDAEVTRTEFKVWSVILCSWSVVFEKMMSEAFRESTTKEVVIKDFSTAAVESFLKFLYLGTIDMPVELVEVSVIADKYQIMELKKLCLAELQEQLDPTCAWRIFRSAHHFHLEDIRQTAKDMIFIQAEEALKERPMVSDALLEEVLGSKSLCIKNEALFSLLSKWNDLDESELNKIALIGKYVSIGDISDGIIRSSGMSKDERQNLQGLKSVRLRSQNTQHTTDLFSTLWQRWEQCCKQLGNQPNDCLNARFLANWVNVSYSLASYAGNWTVNPCYLAQNYSGNQLTLKAGDWIEWRLPQFAVHVLGITFASDVKASSHLEILCAADCSEWHCVFSSKDHGYIKSGRRFACRCDFLVQRFKLRMIGYLDATAARMCADSLWTRTVCLTRGNSFRFA